MSIATLDFIARDRRDGAERPIIRSVRENWRRMWLDTWRGAAHGAPLETANGARMSADPATEREAAANSLEGDALGGVDSADADAALLSRFAAGDQSAARELTERHLGRVLALATRMLKDPAEAEDVAQEAMLRMWRIAPDWRNKGARLSTWLYRVALNLCHDRLRKQRPSSLEAAAEPKDPAPSAQARMEAAESDGGVRAALQQLPQRQRAAILLRHFEERSNPEIAETLSVSVEAVESLLARGRRALREILTGGGKRRDE